MKKLTIVVLNMNGLGNLKVLFESLKKQTYKNFDVIVSDNGSTDGSLEWLKKNKIKHISNGRNLGFSGGNNVAMKKAKTEFIAAFNDDIKLRPNSIEILMDFMEKTPKAGSIQPKILSWDGKLTQSTGLVMTYGSFPAERDKWKPYIKEIKKPEIVQAVQACCAIYRASVLKKAKYFDEIFNPIYNEDFSLGLKIQSLGYHNYYHPQSVITHKGGFTSKRMKYPGRLSFHRNRFKMLMKYGTKRMWIETILWTPLVTAFYLIRKPEPAYFHAWFEFLTGKIKIKS